MTTTAAGGRIQELDVRGLRKPDRHPAIFATYAALPAGAAFVLVNDHDPRPLHDEFEAEHPGSHYWEYLSREPRDWRIRITKLTTTPLPRLLADTTLLAGADAAPDASGAGWRLHIRERDLDVDVRTLAPGASAEARTGPDFDVLLHVLAGAGRLVTEQDTLDLAPGALVWLPRRSRRRFVAGPGGLRYLTVHQRRPALALG